MRDWRSQGDSNPCFRRERASPHSRHWSGLCPTAATRQRGRKMVSNDLGRAPKRVAVEVRIARLRRGGPRARRTIGGQGSRRADRCESVPKIVDAHALEASVPLYRKASFRTPPSLRTSLRLTRQFQGVFGSLR